MNRLRLIRAAVIAALTLAALPAARAEVASDPALDAAAAMAAFQKLADVRQAEGTMPKLSDPRDAPTLAEFWDPKALGAPPYTGKSIQPLMALMDNQTKALKAYLKFIVGSSAKIEEQEARADQFQDEMAQAHSLMIRTAAALMPSMADFIAQLPPEQLTEVRIAGLRQMRTGLVQIVTGAAMTLKDARYKPANQQLVARALAERGAAIAAGLLPEHRNSMRDDIPSALASVTPDAQAALQSFIAAMGTTECAGLCAIQ